MSKPTPQTSRRLDGLVLACLLVGAILILSIIVEAPLEPTLIVALTSVGLLLIYLRQLRNTETSHPSAQTNYDGGRVQAGNFEAFTDAFPRAVAILNPKGGVVHANSAAKDMLSPDMINRPASAYLRSSELRSRIDQAFSGLDVPPLTIQILSPAERVVDVDFSTPIKINNRGEDAKYIVIVIADRTEATLAREKQADFLANASHELKTPIASLKGYIETLRGHAKDDPEARDMFLGIMNDQTDRMERLVSDLLSLRKIESDAHIAPSQTADLCEALQSVKDVLRPLALERDVELCVKFATACPAVIFGKTDECVQLFLNLIENAIKLSPRGETVAVEMDYLPQWNGKAFSEPLRQGAIMRRIVNLAPTARPAWRVTISDSGPGLSRAHLPRIGERFYRVAGDLPAQEKGTGLGLAIVKHVAMRHRAGLFVQSAHKDNPAIIGKTEDKIIEETGTSFSVVFIDRANLPNVIQDKEPDT